jgi:three-Cys-motif partner protein
MPSEHFEQPLRDWSSRKHSILKAYLPTFCTALSNRAGGGPIWYVDGYAGAGIYKDKNNPSAPSEPVHQF